MSDEAQQQQDPALMDSGAAMSAAIAAANEALSSEGATEGGDADATQQDPQATQGDGAQETAGALDGGPGGEGEADAGEASAGDAGSDDAAGADTASDGSGEGEATDEVADGEDKAEAAGEDEEDAADKDDERTINSKYAEIRRREKRIDAREETLDTREQSINQREQQLIRMADKYAARFDEFEQDPQAFMQGYCEARGRDFDKVLAHLNQQRVGVAKDKALAAQAKDPGRDELAERVQRMELAATVNRALSAASEKYPLMRAADPLAIEQEAVEAVVAFAAKHGRNPTADEVFTPIEKRLRFEKWESEQSGESARGSAPTLANPAAPNGASGRGDGEPPAGSGEPSAKHGSGAQANPRRVQSTLTNADAAERSGAAREMSNEEAKRQAVAEAIAFAARG